VKSNISSHTCTRIYNAKYLGLVVSVTEFLSVTVFRRRPGFEPRSGHLRFVVDKVALKQVFSKYFVFPCQFSFHRLLHNHHHLSSGAGTIGQLVADVPSGLSLTSLQKTKKENKPCSVILGSLLIFADLIALYGRFKRQDNSKYVETINYRSGFKSSPDA
jgi:hypothetical protein